MASEEEQAKMQMFHDVKRAFVMKIERAETEAELIELCNTIKADPAAALKSFFDVELGDIGSQSKNLTERKTKLVASKNSIDSWTWA